MRQHNRTIRFRHEDGFLVRTVGGDKSYEHRCTLEVFETVAHAVEETPAQGSGTSLDQIAEQERLPHTQVNVALEFLKDRGLIERRHRRNYPASAAVHLDAMVEWHALREKPT